MQRWLTPLFVLILFFPMMGWSADTNAADTVMAACGKPKKDYTFPTTTRDTYQTRFLSYRGETLWFITSNMKDQDWRLTGWSRSADSTPFLDMGGADRALPCLKKVPSAALVRREPPSPYTAVTPVSINTDNGSTQAWGQGIVAVLGLAAGAVLYFIPCMVARSRKVNSDGGIIALNIFLGWTLIGWVAALIWANTAETVDEARLRKAALENMARFNPTGKV
jgi:hypothetical protein